MVLKRRRCGTLKIVVLLRMAVRIQVLLRVRNQVSKGDDVIDLGRWPCKMTRWGSNPVNSDGEFPQAERARTFTPVK